MLVKPNFPKSDMVSALNAMTELSERNWVATKPPRMAPSTTVRFQRWAFQSNLKNSEYFPAPPMVHNVLRLDDMPNVLPK